MESSIYESFTLPSKGFVYETPINPDITLRSMTTMEEMKRSSPTETPYKLMSTIIEDCMQDKPAVSVYDMAIGDYQFLLHKLRIVTYGSEYHLPIQCSNCGTVSLAKCDLDSLEIKEYDEVEYDKLKKITLPTTNKEIELKYQTPRDLDDIVYKAKERQRKTKTNTDYTLLYVVSSFIKTVDGAVLNPIALEEFIKKLPMKDVNYIIKAGDALNRAIGIDTEVIVNCEECDYEQVVPFRITPEFIGPGTSR